MNVLFAEKYVYWLGENTQKLYKHSELYLMGFSTPPLYPGGVT